MRPPQTYGSVGHTGGDEEGRNAEDADDKKSAGQGILPSLEEEQDERCPVRPTWMRPVAVRDLRSTTVISDIAAS